MFTSLQRLFGFMFGYGGPAPSTPRPRPKRRVPVRISVLLRDHTVIVHRAYSRTIHPDGRLTLWLGEVGGRVVADYAPGAWLGFSAGPRAVSTAQRDKIEL